MITFMDTGPLIAFFNERDQWHRWAKEQFNNYKPPFYTCEAVITESVYQLLSMQKDPDRIMKYVIRDYLKIQPIFSNPESQARIRQIIQTYSNLPADFADACLVHLYERSPRKAQILTVDSDFLFIVRERKRQFRSFLLKFNCFSSLRL